MSRQRIERALAYISEHLDEPLRLEQVAKVAHTSPFHFHRLFASVVGETVGRYVTRRRLEVAALRLAYEPERAITRIALDVGYSSSSNFSKAFAAFFGCSPTEVRKGVPHAAIGKLTRDYGKTFRPRDIFTMPNERPPPPLPSPSFYTCPGIAVACLARSGAYEPGPIVALFEELITRLAIDGPADTYGMLFDSPLLTAPELQRFHACVAWSGALEAPLFRSQIPPGRYAIFKYDGPLDGVDDHYRAIYTVWLPQSGLALDDFTIVDRYTGDFPADGRIAYESWVKIAS